jgi:hypothetical protein
MNLSFDKNFGYFSKIFLEEITKNPQFKIEFGAFAPEIYADIESFSKNANCSCRGKIENYINNNKDKCFEFIKLFIEKNNIIIDAAAIQEKYKTTQYSGKIIQVNKKDWESFVDVLQRERATFRTFSVLAINSETVEVYFI